MQADPIIVFAYGSAKDVKDNFTSEDKYFPTGLFVIRKDLMIKAGGLKSELKRSEDVDITYRLIKLGYKFAIVHKAGYYHLYTQSFSSFLRKTYKRVSYFTESSSSNEFKYVPQNAARSKFLRNMLFDASGIGAAVRIVRGVKKDKDLAWTYYPFVLLSTLLIYSIVLLTNKRGSKMLKNML
jgi:GT2 family glycosyltransferase